MILTLTNFMCHQDYTITIPDKGLIRLAGNNGVGKSTIFEAIVWVLYGKVKRPCTKGANSCSVRMQYKNIEIFRSTHPNRLIVTTKSKTDTKTWEDTAAQNVIHTTIGADYDEFIYGCYIHQHQVNTLLKMTPSQKLVTIEKLAKLNLEKNKEEIRKIKEKCKSYQIDLYKAQAQEKIFAAELEGLGPEPKTPKDEVDESLDTLEDDKNSFNEKLKKVNQLEETLEKLTTKLSNQEKKLVEVQQFNKDRDHYKKSLEEVYSSIKKLKLEKLGREVTLENIGDEVTLENIGVALEELKNTLAQTLEKQYEYQTILDYVTKREKLQSKLSTAKTEKRLLEEKFQSISDWPALKKFWLAYEKFSESRDTHTQNIPTIVKILDKYQLPHEDLPYPQNFYAYRKILSTLSTETYQKWSCPGCKCSVTLEDNKLVLIKKVKVSKVSKEDLATLKSLLLEEVVDEPIYPNLKKVLDHTSKIFGYKISIGDLLKEERRLEKLSEQVEKYTSKLTLLPKPPRIVKNVGALLSQSQSKSKKLEHNLNFLTSAREKVVKLLGFLEDDSPQIETLERNLEKLRTQIVDFGLEKKKLNLEVKTLLESIRKRESQVKYLQYQKDFATLTQKLSKVRKDIETIEAKITGFMGLEVAYKEAEITYLSSVLQKINQRLAFYLGKFVDEECKVSLEVTSTGTTGKPLKMLALTTYIEYKGVVYSDFSELTGGGERQLCILALFLALNDNIKTKFMFLDECLNAMDTETRNRVLQTLHELNSDKLILVVSHQATNVFTDTKKIL